MIKYNYHTHTYRCKHAIGDVSDYAEAAVAAGLEILGISDHTPLPDNRWLEMRMEIKELECYIKAIDEAKEKFSKLTILKGMECEYIEEYHNFYCDELLGKYNLDYLSASAHFYPYKGKWISGWEIKDKKQLAAYVEYIVKMMDTGLFSFVDHPDIFGGSLDKWDDDVMSCSKYLLEAAEELKIPLEINANGFRKGTIQTNNEIRYMYPWEPFWELASNYHISVIINSDAHHPEEIISRMDDAFSLADKYNLQLVEYSTFCNKSKQSH